MPDLPPTIDFAKQPEASARGALRLEYRAEDDYGVEGVKLLIRRPDDPAGETLTLDLDLPDQHAKTAQGAAYVDLTAHPWAGSKVQLQLVAFRRARPDRLERHRSRPPCPSASSSTRSPAPSSGSARRCCAIPARAKPWPRPCPAWRSTPSSINGDIVVFLALRTAADRLVLDRDGDTPPVVAALLWDTAVRVEDGNALASRNDLRQSMQALQDALAQNAPQARDRAADAGFAAADRPLSPGAVRAGAAPRPEPAAVRSVSDPFQPGFPERARPRARAGARRGARPGAQSAGAAPGPARKPARLEPDGHARTPGPIARRDAGSDAPASSSCSTAASASRARKAKAQVRATPASRKSCAAPSAGRRNAWASRAARFRNR